jgi:hypothetical protein
MALPVSNLYLGVSWTDLGLERRRTDLHGQYDRTIVLYDGAGRVAFADSARVVLPDTRKRGGESLMLDQIQTDIAPGRYILGAQIRDPGTGRIHVFNRRIAIPEYSRSNLSLSDLQVASSIGEATPERARFRNGDLDVVPLPSRSFQTDQSIYLYYEVYNLLKNQDGQTYYRVDYRIRGGKPGGVRRLAGPIARFLGKRHQQEEARVSYESGGFDRTERLYVALDLEGNVAGDIRVDVTVTDLKRMDEPSATRTINIKMEDE